MIAAFTLLILAANDVAVPSSCTAQVNARLAELVAAGTKRQVDNVMVCGTATAHSTTQPGGPHGDHQLISVSAPFPSGKHQLVQVVTNDALDGKVTANSGAHVFAYGQAFFDRTGKYVAGVHDVHCSTHATADNGWVVVDGTRSPAGACPVEEPKKRRRHRH